MVTGPLVVTAGCLFTLEQTSNPSLAKRKTDVFNINDDDVIWSIFEIQNNISIVWYTMVYQSHQPEVFMVSRSPELSVKMALKFKCQSHVATLRTGLLDWSNSSIYWQFVIFSSCTDDLAHCHRDVVGHMIGWQKIHQQTPAPASASTEEMLRQHRQWLQNYHRDINSITANNPSNVDTREVNTTASPKILYLWFMKLQNFALWFRF